MANEFIARKGLIVSGSGQITGSLNVSGGITGSLLGTGSWAQNATSSSFATTAITSSYFSGSLQIVGAAEFPAGINLTGSLNISAGGVTGSVFGTASWAQNVTSASFATTASAATSITFIPTTASFATTASAATSITFIPSTASFATTASAATSITFTPATASYAATASNLLGGTANYIPLWTSATAQSSSNMYQSAGNIGIGTTSPNRLLTVNGSANVTGSLDVTGAFTAQTKSFKIVHQRLPGKSLVYGVLEGPEHGVYARGRLKNNSVIQLPSEWSWLVDMESITVHLTPIGTHQKLYVDGVYGTQIVIGNENFFAAEIDCYYTVYATRKDVPPLKTVE